MGLSVTISVLGVCYHTSVTLTLAHQTQKRLSEIIDVPGSNPDCGTISDRVRRTFVKLVSSRSNGGNSQELDYKNPYQNCYMHLLCSILMKFVIHEHWGSICMVTWWKFSHLKSNCVHYSSVHMRPFMWWSMLRSTMPMLWCWSASRLQFYILPHLCCDAIPQQDFNPMLFPISVQV